MMGGGKRLSWKTKCRKFERTLNAKIYDNSVNVLDLLTEQYQRTID